jgi:hypothetical protein
MSKQTNNQTNRQTSNQTDRQIQRPRKRPRDQTQDNTRRGMTRQNTTRQRQNEQTNRQTERPTYQQTDTQTIKQPERQTDSQTSRQTDNRKDKYIALPKAPATSGVAWRFVASSLGFRTAKPKSKVTPISEGARPTRASRVLAGSKQPCLGSPSMGTTEAPSNTKSDGPCRASLDVLTVLT